jgi:tyrosyl-DNA phosphodiesterase-1
MVWLQDIPRRETSIARDPDDLDDLPTTFQCVLPSMYVFFTLGTEVGSIVTVQFPYKAHDPSQHPNLPLQSIEDLRIHWDWTKGIFMSCRLFQGCTSS